MKRALFSFLMALSFAFGISRAQAQLEINPEAEQLRQNAENKLLRTLETFLGDRSKVLVSVQVRVSNAPAASPAPANAKDAEASDSGWLDLGYVTVLGENSLMNENSPANSTGPATPKLRLDAVEADVRVSDKLDEATVKQVQALATNTLQGFNPTVRVTKVAFPESLKSEAAKADELREKEKEKSAPQAGELEKLLQKYGALTPVLGAGILGLGLFFAFFLASRMVSQSANEIAAGIRSIRPQNTPAAAANMAAAIGAATADRDSRKPKAPAAVPPRMREHFRNLAHIKKSLLENPLPFVRSLSDSPDDRRGLKWLLTNISDEERNVLKTFIGAEKLTALATATDLEGVEGDAPFDPTAWLQDQVENLIVRDIAGGSVIERAVRPEHAVKISMAKADALFKIVEELNDQAAWRVALEFLPKDRILKALKNSDTGLWQRLVTGSDLEPAALQAGAEKILARLELVVDDGRFGDRAEERNRFYSNILLDPAIDSVVSKPLGEDDAFLDELSQMAPDFVKLLRMKVWTPKSIERVEDGALREAFAALSSAQKTAILLAMPALVSERLQGFMAEGTGRTIVLDQLRKARERANAEEFESATRLAREFLDFLRKQADEGRLAMNEEEAAPGTAGEANGNRAA